MRLGSSTWLAIAGAAFLLSACAKTEFVRTWTDPEAKTLPAGKVAVAGLTADEHVKKMFEERFSADLRARGNDATALSAVIAHGRDTKPDSVRTVLLAQGYDRVLTAVPLGHDAQQTYVPGSSYYIPDQSYAYWGNYYEIVWDPGRSYETTKRLVSIETNLYDLATRKLLWTGLTESEPSGKLVQDLEEWSKKVIGELAKTGLIK